LPIRVEVGDGIAPVGTHVVGECEEQRRVTQESIETKRSVESYDASDDGEVLVFKATEYQVKVSGKEESVD
jgi:hypothetical protein